MKLIWIEDVVLIYDFPALCVALQPTKYGILILVYSFPRHFTQTTPVNLMYILLILGNSWKWISVDEEEEEIFLFQRLLNPAIK